MMDKADRVGKQAQIMTAVAAMVAGVDVTTAHHAAVTATENNFDPSTHLRVQNLRRQIEQASTPEEKAQLEDIADFL